MSQRGRKAKIGSQSAKPTPETKAATSGCLFIDDEAADSDAEVADKSRTPNKKRTRAISSESGSEKDSGDNDEKTEEEGSNRSKVMNYLRIIFAEKSVF